MALDRHTSLGYVTNHLARLFAHSLQQKLDAAGATVGQFPILLCLWQDDGLTQTELCRRIRVEQPTVANTLKRMERDGLVRRSPDPADGRRAIVTLTERGRALEPELTAHAAEVNAHAAQDFSDEERETYLALSWRLIQNLEDQ